ncbi:hypothetical protein [Azospirillum soli]|uniref:hypothetical protein n=1 Tax=Azospirillum soli TaxID=1304799 RepID=UPI001AE43C1E|nr:hypothetical protein [Azospirillum soli]MBP2314114.1 hypothetical protein [Azospirillum soli]
MGGPAAPPPVALPVATTPTAPAATPVPVAEVTVQKLPERLQEVTRPMVLTGTVAGETPEGLTRVRTSAGEILLKTETPLPPDKPVTLQITPGQTQAGTGQAPATKALILLQSAAVPTPATGGLQTPQAGAGATPSVILPNLTSPTPNATAPTLPLLVPGSVVPALVIAATPKPATPPGAAPVLPGQNAVPQAPLPPQAPTTSSPQAPTAPTGAPVPSPAPAATPQGSPAPASAPMGGMPTGKPMLDTPVQLGGNAAHPGAETPTMATPERAGTAPPEPELPKGGTVALKILTLTPPPEQPKQPGKTGNGEGPGARPTPTAQDTPVPDDTPSDVPVLKGTVAGSTPQGQPILATKQGMLALNVQASLPQGTKVTAALTDPAKALQATAPPLPDLAPMSERDWPAMKQLLTSLAGLDRVAAQTLLNTIMPQPNRKLSAAMTFLLSAIKGGDARAWLGDDATSALKKGGRGDLLSQLEQEFKSLQRQASEPLPGDWRPYTLPMMDSNGPKPIHLYVHPVNDEEDGGDKREGGPKGSRFLLDLDLSRLGPMQLDGLVRPNRFDLILRSHTALPPEFRLDLIQIFADSIRAVGYTGGLSFQSGAKCWVKLTRAGSRGQNVTA